MSLSVLLVFTQWLADVDRCDGDFEHEDCTSIKCTWSVPTAIRWDTQAGLLALVRSICFEAFHASDQCIIQWVCWLSKQKWAVPTNAPCVLSSLIYEDPDRDFSMPMHALLLEELDDSLCLPARAYTNRTGRARYSCSYIVFIASV